MKGNEKNLHKVNNGAEKLGDDVLTKVNGGCDEIIPSEKIPSIYNPNVDPVDKAPDVIRPSVPGPKPWPGTS